MPEPRAPPKYVMLPPASLRGWIWDRVIPLLDGPVTTLDLPGTETPDERAAFSLDYALETLVARVRASAKNVVLVGHSIGGIFASGIAHRAREHVRAVVFIGSWLPPRDRSHLSMLPVPMRLLVRAALATNRRGTLAPAGAFRREYCNDLDETATEEVLRRVVPEPPRLFTTRVRWETRPPPDIPVTYIRLERDKAVAPAVQDRVVSYLGGPRVVSLDAGHLPMLSRPQELAAALNAV